MNKTTKDDVYAFALSKTLTKVSSPATVGLYSSCPNRSSVILEQMEVFMNQEAFRMERERTEGPPPRSPRSLCGFFALIGRLLFYRPVWTKRNQQHRNVRFFYVHFSAWHFAGSDLLWAGIAIRLFQAVQLNFGKLQLVLYRVAQHDEEEEVKKKVVKDVPNNWRSKMICCCPLWFLVLCIVVIPALVLTMALVFGLPKAEVLPVNGTTTTKGHLGVLEGLLIASLGVPAASALRFAFLMGKDLIFSQELNLKRGMDNERISGQLGFMNEVRKEMWLMSRFIQFMEVFEGRRIRAVLQITHLDRCSPKKIVAVLDAINILLSDEESPFISILAVNPQVLVEKVNFADSCFIKEERAYALLNRIVTLAFTVPPLSDESKQNIFYNLSTKFKSPDDSSKRESRRWKTSFSSEIPLVEIAVGKKESEPLMKRDTATLDVKEEEVEHLVWSVLNSDERNLNQYMLDDAMSMRRVLNSIRVTVIIMKALKKEAPQPEHIAAWVVLANQWPCRLSWIMQCVEDAQQRAEIDPKNESRVEASKTLWRVFSESRAELYVMSGQIEDLLEQDGDPEMFERFLKVDFKFTVDDLERFEVVTVNLDQSIRKEMAQIRGKSTLKDSGWMRNLAPLPITTIIKMDTEDVCQELLRMDYSSKYIDIVKSNDLDGLALVFGDADDLKSLLGMNFGEWATFRLHFLGSQACLRPRIRSPLPNESHSRKRLSRFLVQAPHLHSSNLSLANN